MKTLLAILLTLSPLVALADDDPNWIDVAETTQGDKYAIKTGSLTISQGIGMATIRYTDKTNKISFALVGIRVETCSSGMGFIRYFSVQTGKPISEKHDVVLGGGNIAAGIADALCYAIKANAQQHTNRSSNL